MGNDLLVLHTATTK